MSRLTRAVLVLAALLLVADSTAPPRLAARSVPGDVDRLVAALLADTPLVNDLRELSDRIGGRATGTAANLRAVDWALDRFRASGVDARKEAFTMPARWQERSAAAMISGPAGSFAPRVAAMPFSASTPSEGLTAPLVNLDRGDDEDFEKVGDAVRGKFVLIATNELKDVDGLFREYSESAAVERRAFAASVAGVVYMGSRPDDLLYRHNVSIGPANTRPMVVMERDAALRAERLLRAGVPLTLTLRLDLETGGAYESFNVIGEIPGGARAQEVVLMGAHLDSWDLGDGTLDNGANVSMMIDIARQIRSLGLRPARTIRLVAWNGEEQGMIGSMGYAQARRAELDGHVMAGSVDTGCGRITGFFTNGRADVMEVVDRALAPVAGLGPFTNVNVPIVGTDNFDFMLEGVPNVVANQEPALYGPNYHARSDTFDKCDVRELRLNTAIVAALVYGIAQDDTALPRQSRSEIEELMARTDLPQQMKTFNLWEDWAAGRRGRRP